MGAARAFGVPRVLIDVDGTPTLKALLDRSGDVPRLRDGLALNPPPGEASAISALAAGYAEYDAVARDRHVTVFRDGSPHAGHTLDAPVVALAFSGMSQMLAATTDRHRSTVVACSTRDPGERRDVLPAVDGRAAALAASPDAPLHFALALDRGDDGHAIVIGAVEGAAGVTSLTAPGGPAHARGPVALTFVRRRDLVASVGPGALHVWRGDGTHTVTTAYPEHHPRSLDASPDGRWLAAACEQGDVHLWSLAELLSDEGPAAAPPDTPSAPVDVLVIEAVVGPRRAATSARFVSNEQVLVHGEDTHELALWSVPTKSAPRRETAARLPGGRRAGPIALRELDGAATRAYVDRGDAVYEVDLDLARPALRVASAPLLERDDAAAGCAAESRGIVALAGPGDEVVVLQGLDRYVVNAPGGGVRALAFRGQSVLGIGATRRSYRVWDLPASSAASEHGTPWVVHAVAGDVVGMLFWRLVLAGEDDQGRGQVCVQFRLANELKASYELRDPAAGGAWSHTAPVRDVITRQTQERFVVASIASDGPDSLRYWVQEPGRPWRVRAVSVAPPHRLLTIAASPDWTRLVAGCANGDVHVWRTADLAPP